MPNEYDKVKTQHPDYAELAEKRETVKDLRGGTRVLRAKHDVYLPKFDAESALSYENRHKSATFLALYPKTEEAMTGLVFSADIEIGADVPTQIQSILEDVDNCGNHLDVFAKDRFLKSFDGASCFLVNYPPKLDASESALVDKQRRPFWVKYDQDDVINWKYRQNPITHEQELYVVVLAEKQDASTNIFEHATVNRYRVLFLDANNECNYQLFEEQKVKDKTEIVLVDEGMIFQASKNGIARPFNKIPFVVVGNLGNEPPLLDIADKNIEHFQTYSDYKSLIHKTCVPVPYAIGEAEIKVISADSLVQIPSGQGNGFGFAEVSGSSLNVIRQCLEDIKAEIGLLGLTATVDDQTQSAEVTATEVLINSIEETSFLATRARALQDALELGLIYTAQFMGLDTGGSIQLGTAWRKAKEQAEQQALMGQSDPNQESDALIN